MAGRRAALRVIPPGTRAGTASPWQGQASHLLQRCCCGFSTTANPRVTLALSGPSVSRSLGSRPGQQRVPRPFETLGHPRSLSTQTLSVPWPQLPLRVLVPRSPEPLTAQHRRQLRRRRHSLLIDRNASLRKAACFGFCLCHKHVGLKSCLTRTWHVLTSYSLPPLEKTRAVT